MGPLQHLKSKRSPIRIPKVSGHPTNPVNPANGNYKGVQLISLFDIISLYNIGKCSQTSDFRRDLWLIDRNEKISTFESDDAEL